MPEVIQHIPTFTLGMFIGWVLIAILDSIIEHYLFCPKRAKRRKKR